MALDIESAGGGVGIGAIIGAVATFFGLRQRMDRLQTDLDSIKERVVFRDVCKARRDGFESQMDRIEDKLDYITKRIDNKEVGKDE